MPKKPQSQPTDWRANILRDLPDAPVTVRAATYPTALAVIEVAAYNRRMTVEDFIGRAALAVAVYDSDGSDTWEGISEKEPPLRDIRTRKLPRRRLRGRGFGAWRITGMNE